MPLICGRAAMPITFQYSQRFAFLNTLPCAAHIPTCGARHANADTHSFTLLYTSPFCPAVGSTPGKGRRDRTRCGILHYQRLYLSRFSGAIPPLRMTGDIQRTAPAAFPLPPFCASARRWRPYGRFRECYNLPTHYRYPAVEGSRNTAASMCRSAPYLPRWLPAHGEELSNRP